MNFIFWSLDMSFQATSGGPTTLVAAPASGAATATSVAIRSRTGEARARRDLMVAIHDPSRVTAQHLLAGPEVTGIAIISASVRAGARAMPRRCGRDRGALARR